MSRTPLIRRLVAIAVAALIPFGAAASSAHAATQPVDSPTTVVTSDDGSGALGFMNGCFRSSWG
jgi:hypothetical protein